MNYIQLMLEVPANEAEACSDLLTEQDALAVTLEDAKDDPLFEPPIGTTPLWKKTKVIALFEENKDLTELQTLLKKTLDPTLLKSLKTEILIDKDWVRASLDQFKPQCFAEKLWICPSWCANELQEKLSKENSTENKAPKDRLAGEQALSKPSIVFLDPGLAFGTGTHPTTQLCLQWLANHAEELNNKVVLDFGCGSGILGIAALMLGAKQLIAVDHDPQAIASTIANAKLNAIESPKIICVDPENTNLEGIQKADIILANILATPLINLAHTLIGLLKSKGKMILSGILNAQTEAVIKAYQHKMKNFQIEDLEGWVRIEAILK